MYRGVFFRIRGYFFHGLHDLSQRACVRDDTTLSIKFEIEFWRSTGFGPIFGIKSIRRHGGYYKRIKFSISLQMLKEKNLDSN